jgi:hypothetical protein
MSLLPGYGSLKQPFLAPSRNNDTRKDSERSIRVETIPNNHSERNRRITFGTIIPSNSEWSRQKNQAEGQTTFDKYKGVEEIKEVKESPVEEKKKPFELDDDEMDIPEENNKLSAKMKKLQAEKKIKTGFLANQKSSPIIPTKRAFQNAKAECELQLKCW